MHDVTTTNRPTALMSISIQSNGKNKMLRMAPSRLNSVMWNRKWGNNSTAERLWWLFIGGFLLHGCRICYARRPGIHRGWSATRTQLSCKFLIFIFTYCIQKKIHQGREHARNTERWDAGVQLPPLLCPQSSTGPDTAAAARPLGAAGSCRALTSITETGLSDCTASLSSRSQQAHGETTHFSTPRRVCKQCEVISQSRSEEY